MYFYSKYALLSFTNQSTVKKKHTCRF